MPRGPGAGLPHALGRYGLRRPRSVGLRPPSPLAPPQSLAVLHDALGDLGDWGEDDMQLAGLLYEEPTGEPSRDQCAIPSGPSAPHRFSTAQASDDSDSSASSVIRRWLGTAGEDNESLDPGAEEEEAAMAAELALGSDDDEEQAEPQPAAAPLPQGGLFQHCPDPCTKLKARFSLHCGDATRNGRLLCDRYISIPTGVVYEEVGVWPMVIGGKCATCFSREARLARLAR